jgi:hypothetical protein
MIRSLEMLAKGEGKHRDGAHEPEGLETTTQRLAMDAGTIVDWEN